MKEYLPLARHYEKRDPEDLAQELAIFAWKLRKQRENPRFIVRKLQWYSMDYRRKRQKEVEMFQTLESISPESTLAGGGFAPVGVLERLASQIPLKSKEVPFRLICEGFTQREIAKELRISKSQASRLVAEIRNLVSDSL